MYPKELHNKYGGKYVATKKFNDFKIIAFGNDVKSVLNDAISKGCNEPYIFYITPKDTINIYHAN